MFDRAIIEGKDDYTNMKDVMTSLNEHILREHCGPVKLGMSFWGGGAAHLRYIYIHN